MSNSFRTIVEDSARPPLIQYDSPLLFMGSCFAENMGKRLGELKFPVLINPFGILYNPRSLFLNLRRMLVGSEFTRDDLEQQDGRFFSLHHHGRFSADSPELCLDMINGSLQQGREFLKSTRFLFLTFGTAWVYEHKKRGEVVANCHRLPGKDFTRRLLKLEEITGPFREIIDYLREFNPGLKLVFTVSPIRHLRDGARQNTVSKSLLHYAVHELREGNPELDYFPAYEIMMDDLRDYRFYGADMQHPSETALDYIWDRFRTNRISPEASTLMKAILGLKRAMNHRARDPESTAHQKFLENQRNILAGLKGRFPDLDFSEETRFFHSVD